MNHQDTYELIIKPELINEFSDEELVDTLCGEIISEDLLELLIDNERFEVLNKIYATDR